MHPTLLSALALSAALLTQPLRGPLDPPANGPRQVEPGWHILTHATVHTQPGQTFDDASVYIKDGTIEAVVRKESDKLPLGGGYRVWDCTGLHIYPGFIDAYAEVDTPRPPKDAPGQHWNNRVTPQRSALDGPGLAPDAADTLRKLGFTAAAIVPKGPGIFRGSSAVISLAKPPEDFSADRPPVYLDAPYQTIAFDLTAIDGPGPGAPADSTRWTGYPDSEMGAIALIRQTLIDADWQARAREAGATIEPNCLDALNRFFPRGDMSQWKGDLPAESVPLFFNSDDELEALRAVKISREFGRDSVLLGSGLEFRRLDAISTACGMVQHPGASELDQRPAYVPGEEEVAVILPLNFPKPPNVSSLGAAENTDLRELMTWEQAPTNPRRLDEAGLRVAITSSKLGKGQNFSDSLRAALKHGLKPDRALAMLTTNPAAILGVSDSVGTIDHGKVANLIVSDGDLFQPWSEKDAKGDTKKPAKILDLWIDGRRHEIAKPDDKSAVGTWHAVEFDGKPAPPNDANAPTIVIANDLTVTIKVGDKSVKATNVHAERGQIDYTYENTPFGNPGVWTDRGTISGDEMVATSLTPSGSIHRWKAHRSGPPEAADKGTPGKYRMTLVDAKPRDVIAEGEAFITIKPDNTVLLSGMGKDVTPDEAKVEGDKVAYTLNMEALGGQGLVKVQGKHRGDTLAGSMVIPDGSTHTWQAERVNDANEAEQRERDAIASIPETYGYPFGPYAMIDLPAQEAVLFTDVTLWTSTGDGIIENGWIFINAGKIAGIGGGPSPRVDNSVKVVSLAGRHITPGLIDAHSHTGISRGVNEAGQPVTAEVRIQDVTDPDDINWYRELAGGLTTVNSMHGSANPIGGQIQTNKIRWGAIRPDDMHFEGARPGIKFALGENVKQSHWGDTQVTRYPQTRMGVETTFRDRFTAAKEYMQAKEPRRDLELEALAEILKGERGIQCHSYRQDEILMLCRIADEFGFKLGAWQHGLECYKVADEVKTHAIGASIFSDWWNYKVEVQDAIPQAGPILWEQGVNVSYNSDSDELARRMNVEAAKAVKYSSPDDPIAPEEALKFVTINPARQLVIDKWVGSLEVGKDADIAVWSGPPLSAMTRCEQTWIDGRCYFSLEKDAEARKQIASERRRIIQKILSLSTPEEKKPEEPKKDGAPEGQDPKDEYYRAALREQNLDLLRRGIDPAAAVCGDCGMTQVQQKH